MLPALLTLLLLLPNAVLTKGQSTDPREISFEDLLLNGNYFTESGVTNYTQMLIDISRNQIVVGARDSLFRLSLERLDKLEKASWLASAEKVALCNDKGQTEDHCHNYIKVLLTNGRRLFTCGTGAFSPQCSWREMEEVNRVTSWVRGIAKCPYNPRANVTSLLSLPTGQFFAGTPVDFSGADPAIVMDPMDTGYRLDPSNSRMLYLRTNQYNSNWLNEPQFVATFETDAFVYFLFRESAVEYINCGKIIYSRIARVCKNDTGGQVMLRDNWTTFVKARLNCSLPGEYPFYYDNIQGATYLRDRGLLYATFTTPDNSIPGSAICLFNTSAIEEAFDGPFKYQASAGSAWERKNVPNHHSTCTGNQTGLDSTRYQLMDLAVQPMSTEPLYHSELETLTHIVVDTISTKINNKVDVLYVATNEGVIKKISVLPRTLKTCVLEIWKPLPPNSLSKKIHALQLSLDSLYVSTDEGVMRIWKEHCRRYKNRLACLASMDPHCGWHEHKELCMLAPDNNPLSRAWHQDANQCPTLVHPVDGGWTAWSSFSPCEHSNGDTCLCSTRTCGNPSPSNGGKPCNGFSIKVTNCTVHGGWTAWSVWSACSQTCGMAVKTRRRSCGNPAPQHGGRVCIGQDRSEMYCHSNPPCPTASTPVLDGGWSSWGPWGECSAKCGGGYRFRYRTCSNPPPQLPGGLDCQGCHIDYQECNSSPCFDSRRLSSWTQWIPLSNGTERRFRFSCKAPVPDSSLIKVGLFKTDDRYCSRDGICTKSERLDVDEVWSEWSAWSPCSAGCGTGQQSRVRTCEGPHGECTGPTQITKLCNLQPCKGEWSCWSEWSPCTSSCGLGTRQRTRVCIGEDKNSCDGKSVAHQDCNVSPCLTSEGWYEWSIWSECDSSGHQTRTRTCSTTSPGCIGPDIDSRLCVDAITSEASGLGIGTAIGCLLVGLLLGFISFLIFKKFLERRSTNRLPSSPHYISSKQNPYVTVPLKETPRTSPKRAPSFNRQNSNGSSRLFKGTMGGNGLPVEYETATIKRNSHSLVNGNLRTDLTEQDKFF
ncbi:semaphorin-5B isoform X1 [Cimex lectularius]|uniref:Sema domain-containing protein n=1 Tax=Cimex lectularius TaxID=79782 RepID=A0A8I6TMW7_CIMLE|nr:semaphorin-5B isoform X1 [Cimex lectularius]